MSDNNRVMFVTIDTYFVITANVLTDCHRIGVTSVNQIQFLNEQGNFED